MPRSFNIHFNQTTSKPTTTVPLYSAFVLNSATVGCFLLLQEMAPLLREKANPEVDHLSALQKAQLAVMYPSSCIGVADL